ncbi:zinc ribbon domain-containing protein [Dictyobacter arantiisoli]|uniref:DZANK-type domain-containing protein n=1 Tax=Dictyobacter arantiisoli TaxID=2014874 RepID=A0A5A5TB92_9CHLR|nr:zinc ribbon domain-containing protein [Dictyobacter arantiisoli]GCF08702.1 hypothetical protein KDI_22660 [Dictyobacter arantiisoli]
MSTTQPAVNYFILLEINPDAPWSDADFDQIVRQRRNDWSRKRNGVGSAAQAAKQKLEQLKGYEILKNPAEREKQAREARNAQTGARDKEMAEMTKALEFITAKGYIEQNEIDALLKRYPLLTEQDIRKLLTVPISTAPNSGNAAKPPVQRLNETTFKDINNNLSILHMQTFYELLNLDATTSNEILYQAAEALYNDVVKRKPSSEIDAKKHLAGKAMVIFKTAEERHRYDESIRYRKLEAILKEFSNAISSGTRKHVTLKQVEALLERTREAGWDDEEALNELIELARQRAWTLELPVANPQAQKLQRCGHCAHMNEPEHKFCQYCNYELLTTCPDCGTNVKADAVGCNACGFAVGNRFRVDDLLEKLPHTQGIEAQLELLDEAARLWKPARSDKRVQTINLERAALLQKRQERQPYRQQLDAYIRHNQFYAAQRYLEDNREQIDNAASLGQEIDARIRQAGSLRNRAQASRNTEEQADLYRQALLICSDDHEAREQLSKMPPTPASALSVRINNAQVTLNWLPSPTQGVRYQIIRMAYKQPATPRDGTLLATVSAITYTDTQAEIGIPLYYTIFTECEGIIATQPALLSMPIFLIQDIQDELLEVDHQKVILQWSTPPNVQSIVVVRKERLAPHTIEDGQRLILTDNARLIDTDVLNEHIYYYKIYSQFNNQGKILTSPGKVIKARPEAPPDLITELAITNEKQADGYQVYLKWKTPSKGKAIILKSEQSSGLKSGKIIPMEHLARYGTTLEGQSDNLTDEWPSQGSCYYTPFVCVGRMAYCGTEVHYACIDEVENLSVENLGTVLRLRWDWPSECREVMIAYKYAAGDSKMEFSRTITRSEYANAGYLDIRGEKQCDYFIRVTNLIRQGQHLITSAGVDIQARLVNKLALTYEIKKALFSQKRTLHIRTLTPGELPTILLIARRDHLPAKKTDGERILQLEGPISIKKELSFPLPDRKYSGRTFSKLYVEDDSAYDYLKIQHPSDTTLRLD